MSHLGAHGAPATKRGFGAEPRLNLDAQTEMVVRPCVLNPDTPTDSESTQSQLRVNSESTPTVPRPGCELTATPTPTRSAEEVGGASSYDPFVADSEKPEKPKKALTAGALEEAKALVWAHRKRLALGLGLMLISRLSDL